MVKTITIMDDVYEKLCMLKGDAPLSDLIEKMLWAGKGSKCLKRLEKPLC